MGVLCSNRGVVAEGIRDDCVRDTLTDVGIRDGLLAAQHSGREGVLIGHFRIGRLHRTQRHMIFLLLFRYDFEEKLPGIIKKNEATEKSMIE